MAPSDDTTCLDCGYTFPLREGAGPCLKCKKLANHSLDSPEYQDLMKWPQCSMCGITRRNMPSTGVPQHCGSTNCSGQSASEGVGMSSGSGPLTTSSAYNASGTASEPNQLRAAATATRLRRAGFQPSQAVGSSRLTTSRLQDHQHGGGAPGEAKTYICFQVRISNSPKKINDDLGNGARKVANSRAIIDVKAELLETMNVEWIRSNSAHLLNEEVHLRFPGNRLLLPNTLTLNVGEFYLHYSSSSNAAIYIDVVPKIFQGLTKTKIPLICLELYIDYEAYTTRVIGDENFGSLLGKRNRLDSNASMGPPSQIRRSSYAMVSKFALPKRSGPFIQRSAVSLKKITCDIDENGGPSFTEQDQVLNGYIRDECIGKGTMKVVYDLELITAEVKTSAYVVKRFFCLDDKGSAVSVAANLDEVQAEMTRLAWASSFLAEFYNYCKSVPGASVDETLFFPSDTFLAREITSPSQASGITSLSDGEAITWIVEPKRALSVMKFSGTLDHHPQRRDRCAQTVYAFAHFAWGQSNNCLVFADIQGTPARHNGKDSLALFDIMTHTVTGDSGVGDSGEEGIQSFLQDHKCLDICKQLGLDATIPLLLPRSKGKGREQVADTDPESEESQDDDL